MAQVGMQMQKCDGRLITNGLLMMAALCMCVRPRKRQQRAESQPVGKALWLPGLLVGEGGG